MLSFATSTITSVNSFKSNANETVPLVPPPLKPIPAVTPEIPPLPETVPNSKAFPPSFTFNTCPADPMVPIPLRIFNSATLALKVFVPSFNELYVIEPPLIFGDVKVLFVKVWVALVPTNSWLLPDGNVNSLLTLALCGWDFIICPWLLFEQFSCICPTAPLSVPSPLNSVIFVEEVISKFSEVAFVSNI